MKPIFLIYVLFMGQNGYEEMNQASDMQFASASACQAELEHYANTQNLYFFCGDAELYFNKQQTFY